MSRRIALADQLYGGNVVSTVLAPLCPNMVIWLKILKLTRFKLCPSPKKMRHINFNLSMKSNHFSQEMVHEGPFSDTRSPTTFKFCKIGLKNTLFIFGRKNCRLLLFVVCCLLLFVATLSDFGLLFFLIEALIELRKMLPRKKLYHVRFRNCLTPKVPRFCRFTKMQLT